MRSSVFTVHRSISDYIRESMAIYCEDDGEVRLSWRLGPEMANEKLEQLPDRISRILIDRLREEVREIMSETNYPLDVRDEVVDSVTGAIEGSQALAHLLADISDALSHWDDLYPIPHNPLARDVDENLFPDYVADLPDGEEKEILSSMLPHLDTFARQARESRR